MKFNSNNNFSIESQIRVVEDQDGIGVPVDEKDYSAKIKEEIVLHCIKTTERFAKRYKLDIQTLIDKRNRVIELENKIAEKSVEYMQEKCKKLEEKKK